MNAEILETIGASLLRFGVEIPELLAQRKFVLAGCHAIPELLTQRKFVSAECQSAKVPE